MLSQIFFQWGEFNQEKIDSFFENIIVQIIATGLTFFGTFILLRKQIQNERKVRKNVEQQKLIELLEYVTTSLKSNLSPIAKQKEAIDAFLPLLRESKVVDLKFELIASLNFDWIDSIDKVIFRQSFFRYFLGDDLTKFYYYNQLISNVLLLKEIRKSMGPDFELTLTTSIKYESDFNEGKALLFKVIDEIRRTYLQHREAGLSEMQRDLAKASNAWFQLPEVERNDMFVTHNVLIQDVMPVIQKYWDERLLEGVRKAIIAFENYKKFHSISDNKFSHYNGSLIKAHKRFNVIIRKLDASLNNMKRT